MKITFVKHSRIWAVVSALAVVVFGGEGKLLRVEFASTGKIVADANRLRSWMLDDEQTIVSGRWDPEAESVYTAAQKATASLIRTDKMILRSRSTTSDSHGNDLMLVSWDATIQGKESRVVLYDSYIKSRYLIAINGASKDQMAALLPHLFVSQGWETAKVIIHVRGEPSPSETFELRSIGSSMAWIHDYEISGGSLEGNWFLALTVGKGLLTDYYGQTVGVPERFPPLQARLKPWSDQKIASELSSRPFGRTDRDQILMTELASRGWSVMQFSELLRKAGSNGPLLKMRFDQVAAALSAVDHSKVEPFSAASLEQFAVIGSVSEEAAESAASTGCSNRLEGIATKLVQKRLLLRAAFGYMWMCGISPEAYAAVEAAVVPSALDSTRRFALQAIGERTTKELTNQRDVR